MKDLIDALRIRLAMILTYWAELALPPEHRRKLTERRRP
jgi:hypothetical protein